MSLDLSKPVVLTDDGLINCLLSAQDRYSCMWVRGAPSLADAVEERNMLRDEITCRLAALRAVFVELTALRNSGYDGEFMGERIRPLMMALSEAEKACGAVDADV